MSHPGPSAVEIVLSADERAELVRRAGLPERQRSDRARIILACAEGMSNAGAAQAPGVSVKSVSKCIGHIRAPPHPLPRLSAIPGPGSNAGVGPVARGGSGGRLPQLHAPRKWLRDLRSKNNGVVGAGESPEEQREDRTGHREADEGAGEQSRTEATPPAAAAQQKNTTDCHTRERNPQVGLGELAASPPERPDPTKISPCHHDRRNGPGQESKYPVPPCRSRGSRRAGVCTDRLFHTSGLRQAGSCRGPGRVAPRVVGR